MAHAARVGRANPRGRKAVVEKRERGEAERQERFERRQRDTEEWRGRASDDAAPDDEREADPGQHHALGLHLIAAST
jgi:hypothetical protein